MLMWKHGIQLGVTQKLLMAFIITNGVVVILMLAFIRWNFGRGFRDYIHQTELRRLDALTVALEAFYAEEGNWEFLRHQPRRWAELLRHTDPYAPPRPPPRRPEARKLERSEPPRSGRRRRRRPPPDPTGFGARLALLDANKIPVMGRPATLQNATVRQIRHAHGVVGWLQLSQLEAVTNDLDRRFITQQSRAFALVAGVAIAMAAGGSIVLARHFLSPIKDLPQGTRALIAGQFHTRIPTTTNDELGQLSRDFNTLAHTLEQNEQARRQFTADMSHELRTPLAILRGEIEAMQDGVRACNAASLQSLHAEALTLNTLVDDLYELSLSDIGALTYRKTEVDLIEIIEAAMAAFQSRLSAHDLTWNTQHERQPLQVIGDAERLTQLLSNLCENTLRYTDAGGQLRVRTETVADHVLLHVEDAAPGVPEVSLTKLFDRLYRVEASRNRSRGGAGLGLAICKNIVEAHEGLIEARPSLLGGLWIQITLPLASRMRFDA